MMSLDKFRDSEVLTSLRENVRLQWMLFAIIAILCLSLSKTALDSLDEPISEIRTQQALLLKLKLSESHTIDPDELKQNEAKLADLLAIIPTATSIATAEAKTLVDVDELVGKQLMNLRMNLLGTEEIKVGSSTFWTVRVDVAGQVKDKAILSVLEHFDKRQSNSRLASLQFSPKTANSITLVVDMLYKEQKQ